MKRILVLVWMFWSIGLFGQQILEAEYFFDVDPGIGSGTPISITASQDISDLMINIDVSGLSQGIHNLNVRAKDDTGSWSLTQKHNFLKSLLPSSSPIEELEYYFDIDPGFGNGSSISITPDTDIQNHLANISISGIVEGVHKLHLRARNDEGVWSHVDTKSIYVTQPILVDNIVSLEYFIGDDPGDGSGVPVSVTASNDIQELSIVVPENDLEFGINKLTIRSKDGNGKWSHSSTASILRMSAPILPNIEEVEYFFNDDPGFGNGTFVSFTPNPEWSDLSVLISVNSLPDGLHVLYLRSRDANGHWSLNNSIIIQKTTIVELSDITELEYYFDIDPGFGSGTAISITPDTNIENNVATISVAGLSNGIHTLFVRSKNENGVWSLSQTMTILKKSPNTIHDVVQMEYYIDTDPGLGMADSIIITELPDISNFNSMISLSGLSLGIHKLYVRSKDAEGKWSQTYNSTFLHRGPDIVESITKIEYYFGDDPGLGNGVDITGVTPETNIIDLNHLIDITNLQDGVQSLCIRSRNDLGVWTHTYIQPIYVNRNINLNMVKAEYFIDLDPGYGLATEITFSPVLDKIDHLFPIDVSGLDFGIFKLHVRYMSANNKWTQDEITPFYYKDGSLYDMVDGEYFIDLDPGLGMATPFTFPDAIDVADLSILIMTSGLEAGEHDLYIRTKNSIGEWSLTNVEFDIEIQGTLPLSFLSFDVYKKENSALLEWNVKEAFNTSHFEIERTNNSNFIYIGRVVSIDEQKEVTYNFIDSKPEKGWNYYRLKQVDLDGSFEYSSVRSLNFDSESDIIVYPNPSIDQIRVGGLLETNASYLIYNSNYKLVKKGEFRDSNVIDVVDLIPGAYHFVLHNGSETKSFLLIKI